MAGAEKPCATSLRADIVAVKGTVGQLYYLDAGWSG
jgi:hypothetical protein